MADVYPVLQGLLECAQQALGTTAAGAPESACVVTGQVAWDNCECGMLRVSLQRSFFSQNFPSSAQTTADQFGSGKCGHPIQVHQVQVMVLRCEPPGGPNSEPPDCLVLSAAAQTKIDDAQAVLGGVLCCLQVMQQQRDSEGNRIIQYFMVGDQTYVGPQGGCGGSTFTVMLGFLAGCPCG